MTWGFIQVSVSIQVWLFLFFSSSSSSSSSCLLSVFFRSAAPQGNTCSSLSVAFYFHDFHPLSWFIFGSVESVRECSPPGYTHTISSSSSSSSSSSFSSSSSSSFSCCVTLMTFGSLVWHLHSSFSFFSPFFSFLSSFFPSLLSLYSHVFFSPSFSPSFLPSFPPPPLLVNSVKVVFTRLREEEEEEEKEWKGEERWGEGKGRGNSTTPHHTTPCLASPCLAFVDQGQNEYKMTALDLALVAA